MRQAHCITFNRPTAPSPPPFTSLVPAVPPKSGVRGAPAFSTAAPAFLIAAAPFGNFKWSSIIPAERIAASGLAMPLPAMSGAEPWTGSNRLGYLRSELVNEFLTALSKNRDPWPNAVQSANWTCVGICAHQSALKGGEIIRLPEFTLA